MKSENCLQLQLRFDGSNYDATLDHDRLKGQIRRVLDCMLSGTWRTLGEIEEITGDPQASISAQLRHLRKERFGAFILDKRRRGEPENGLWEYRITGMTRHELIE